LCDKETGKERNEGSGQKKSYKTISEKMIEAGELRIGNRIKFKDKYFTIFGISFLSDIDSKRKGFVVDLIDNIKKINETPFTKDIEPISLTPEILEKCGFENDDNLSIRYSLRILDDYELVFGRFDFEPDRKGIWLDCDDSFYSKDLKITYVHQLQNIYFALTGEELQINL